MKQHITVEQLGELSDEEKDKLRIFGLEHCITQGSIWACWAYRELYPNKKPEYNMWIEIGDVTYEYGYDPNYYVENYPLLSIGQMIEFLVEYDIKTTGSSLYLLEGFSATYGSLDGVELCDDLWEAVKAVL